MVNAQCGTVAALYGGNGGHTLTVVTVTALCGGNSGHTCTVVTGASTVWKQLTHSQGGNSGCTLTVVTVVARSRWQQWLNCAVAAIGTLVISQASLDLAGFVPQPGLTGPSWYCASARRLGPSCLPQPGCPAPSWYRASARPPTDPAGFVSWAPPCFLSALRTARWR